MSKAAPKTRRYKVECIITDEVYDARFYTVAQIKKHLQEGAIEFDLQASSIKVRRIAPGRKP